MESDHAFHEVSFKGKTPQELETMIAELAPLEETRFGQDMIAKGLEKGLEKGRGEVVRKLAEHGMSVAEIAKYTDFLIQDIERILGEK